MANNQCEIHGLRFNFFCRNENCFVPVCGDCLVLKHTKSNGHDVVDIAEMLNSNILEDMKNAKRNDLTKLRDCILEIERQRDSLETNTDYVTALVDRKFQEYQDLLDQRKRSLLQELSNRKAEKFTMLQAEVEKSQQVKNSLSESLRTFSLAMRYNNLPTIFRTYSELRGVDLTERFQSQFDLIGSLTFSARNVSELEKAVRNVGEIKEEVCRL